MKVDWLTKALVLATQTSCPARRFRLRSLIRWIVEYGTLTRLATRPPHSRA
jgi:hypothetical protein